MAVSISDLSDDIIIAIAAQVKAFPWFTMYMSNSVLVCKRWYTLGVHILYGNMFLINEPGHLDKFISAINPSIHTYYIRSMTIQLEKGPRNPRDEWDVARFMTQKAAALTKEVAPLIEVLPSLQNFTSFSLRLDLSGHLSIHRSDLRDTLGALPESCVALDLDTYGQDHRMKGEKVHLCDTIRRLLW